jgi:hypothetical protein
MRTRSEATHQNRKAQESEYFKEAQTIFLNELGLFIGDATREAAMEFKR